MLSYTYKYKVRLPWRFVIQWSAAIGVQVYNRAVEVIHHYYVIIVKGCFEVKQKMGSVQKDTSPFTIIT